MKAVYCSKRMIKVRKYPYLCGNLNLTACLNFFQCITRTFANSTAGVEAVISDENEKNNGTIRYYGCPAEEVLSGKREKGNFQVNYLQHF